MSDLEGIFDALFPICRSITGPGLEDSLAILAEEMPLSLTRVPSGTSVFDWKVPKAWSIKSASLRAPDGSLIADFKDHNLHVVNYSEPVERTLTLDELKPHIYSLPQLPGAIPYVTSYYKPHWGFCLPHKVLKKLKPGSYHASIDSKHEDGFLTYGDCVLEGDSDEECVLSSYLCHPSMANNELSGPLTLLRLYNKIKNWKHRRFTYRFVLYPETIGSLCYLKTHGEHLKKKMAGGLVFDLFRRPEENPQLQAERRGNSLLDQCVFHMPKMRVRLFDPTCGSDERQYCSPGFNLPMGQIARTIYGDYKEYHSSLDNKAFMRISQLEDAANQIEDLLLLFENAGCFQNLQPYGEPQLGARGLYPNVNSDASRDHSSDAVQCTRTKLNRILTILNQSDGTKTMLEISGQCGCSVQELEPIIRELESHQLLQYANSGQ